LKNKGTMESDKIYKEAKKRVKAKKGFFGHLISYVMVLLMLSFIMNFENGGNYFPVIIVALSWGIGLAIHYFNAFGTEHLGFLGFNSNWEEEELAKEVDRLARIKELKERMIDERLELKDLEALELKELEKRMDDRDFV